MIEKGKISGLQMAILLYPTIVATAELVLPAITGEVAKQDMWLSPIWASFFGYLSVLIAYRLHSYYPKETLLQYSETIAGKIPGKLIGCGILFFLLHTNGMNLRDFGEFVNGNFLEQTPLTVTIASMAFVCALAVRGGLEVMARSSQIFVPVFILLFMFIVVLLIPALNPGNIAPVLGEGLTPSIKGALVPTQWFNELFLISFLLPYLGENENGLKWGMITTTLIMITLVITNLLALLLFGDITSSFTYPIMDAARYISVADFLQHVEAVEMAIWVTGMFIKISVFYYAAVIGLAQLLNLSDYRPIVFPIGLLLISISMWAAPNLQKLTHFSSTTWPFYALLFQMIIPILLLLAVITRKKFSKTQLS
ncbi:germination protein [Lentibacillus kapialis]|uniref:Germination protein n=1 Tax=Lentibacillus kapialis TaxID=340214 RepID=A0A917UZ68_9BACI|nr:endospore germination permease [Lentibacillus kapialis]GGJ99375.1 germination protein [Lentibacillus kapialis]